VENITDELATLGLKEQYRGELLGLSVLLHFPSLGAEEASYLETLM
jgi:hypothetical protein